MKDQLLMMALMLLYGRFYIEQRLPPSLPDGQRKDRPCHGMAFFVFFSPLAGDSTISVYL